MKCLVPLFAALACVFAAPARADRLIYKDGGELKALLVQIILDVRGKSTTIPRDQIRAVSFKKDEWQVLMKSGQLLVGKPESVTVSSAVGEKRVAGSELAGFTLARQPAHTETEPAEKPAEPEPKDDSKPDLGEDKEPAKTKLTAEEIARIRTLAKTAVKLRDEALQAVRDGSAELHTKLREKYLADIQTAKAKLDEAKKDLGKHLGDIEQGRPKFSSSGLGVGVTRTQTVTKTPAAAAALDSYNKAQARYDALVAKVKAAAKALADRRDLQLRRVEAWHQAVLDHLRKGHPIPEDKLKQIYELAVDPSKKKK